MSKNVVKNHCLCDDFKEIIKKEFSSKLEQIGLNLDQLRDEFENAQNISALRLLSYIQSVKNGLIGL